MTNIEKFTFNRRDVRMVQKDGDPWWVLKDVCDCIGISDYHQAHNRLDADERGMYQIPTPGGMQNLKCVNESGLYSLILRSDKPEAKVFKKWVTSEVLPSIRRHSAYLTPEAVEKVISNPDTLIRICTDLKAERKLKEAALARVAASNKVIKALRPKAEYTDKVLLSDGLVKMNDIAVKLGTTAIKLNRFLRDAKVIYKQGGTWYPMADCRDKGLFDFHVNTYSDSKGRTRTKSLLKATENGRKMIMELWNNPQAVKSMI